MEVFGVGVHQSDQVVLVLDAIVINLKEDRIKGLVEVVDVLSRRLPRDGGHPLGEPLEEANDILQLYCI